MAQSFAVRTRPWAGVLMAFTAVTFGMASLVHFGVPVPLGLTTVHDPFPGAKFPELIIGVVLLAGAIPVLTRARYARPIGLATTGFATAGTITGLNFTLGSGRTGDLVYHFGVLALLVLTLVLLSVRRDKGLA